ncbi:MAG: hypothetical protein ABI091_27585 [Ferruginibacter sp.]
MTKKITVALLILTGLFSAKQNFAQTKSADFKTYHVAIFAPLYLDSAFTETQYNYGKSFPKFSLQALDFVQGAQVALDSMPLYNGNIRAAIYDSKSYTEPIDSLIANKSLDSLDLIIGAVKDEDFLQLANFAKAKNIPFISATYPNDAGITEDPFFGDCKLNLKSPLRSHLQLFVTEPWD